MQVEEIARDIGYLNSMTYQTAAMMTENAKRAAKVGQNGNRKTTERNSPKTPMKKALTLGAPFSSELRDATDRRELAKLPHLVLSSKVPFAPR
jgi:hypothetical protein